jgi:membrane-associated phospholipid phosphatase
MLLRPRIALIGAATGVGLLILTWALAFHVGAFGDADQSIFRGFVELSAGSTIHRIATPIAQLCDPKPYTYLAAIPLLVSVARRRFGLAVGIGAILLGANVTTELLKPLLAQPRAGSLFSGGVSPLGPSSWPSGHATAAMAWTLCMILAVPARLRPAMGAFGAALAVAVSYSFLVLGWHYPSDVLGGYLVAAIWTLLGVAALRAAEIPFGRPRVADRERRVSVRAALTPPVAALVLAMLLAVLLALARPHEVADYARAHGTFMIGAAAIGMLALGLATGMVLALRQR